jgi:hypothetical protein
MVSGVKWLLRAGASFWHVDDSKEEKDFAFDLEKFSA